MEGIATGMKISLPINRYPDKGYVVVYHFSKSHSAEVAISLVAASDDSSSNGGLCEVFQLK